jgi:succinate dehydrogenase (ubiquinone) cytochrome b560 subunit
MDSGVFVPTHHYHHVSYIYRHLAWDMGHGFKIPELYKTGWFVVGLSVVTALGLAAI